jgi:hypothetical protein
LIPNLIASTLRMDFCNQQNQIRFLLEKQQAALKRQPPLG